MEHVTIKYPKPRTVLIDGEESGTINSILRVEEGTHTFRLNASPAYQKLLKDVHAANHD